MIAQINRAEARRLAVFDDKGRAEFYKDVVKVIIWNQHRKKKLSFLTFITEEKYGRPFLDAPMPRACIKYLAKQGLNVRIEYVRHG